MRTSIVAIAIAFASIACRRDRGSPAISSDPAPSTSTTTPRGKLSVRKISFRRGGAFSVSLSWPEITLASDAGAAMTTTISDTLRAHAAAREDLWTKAASDATGRYDERCDPTIVAQTFVSVICHAVYTGPSPSADSETYAWVVDGDRGRRVSIEEIVGSDRMESLASAVSAQLVKSFGARASADPKALVAGHDLDVWMVNRSSITFVIPSSATKVRDELYGSLDWATLRAAAKDPALVDRMSAAASAPDSLFGYPADAGL